LSDVPYLAGYNDLAFKYDSEVVGNSNAQYYYYPGFNRAYPKRLADVYDDDLKDINGEMSSLFTRDNLFIVKCDSQTIILRAGQIQIPVTYNDTESFIAYEDYWDDDNKYQYDTTQVENLKYVQAYTFDGCDFTPAEFDDPDGIDLEIRQATPYNDTTLESCLYQLSVQHGVNFGKVEELSAIGETDYMNCDMASLAGSIENLKKFLNVYVHYKRNPDKTLTLYFNYYNYINTPYVRIDGNKTKMDTIDGTYLKLKPGEDGKLDIVIQIKYYYDDQRLYGIRNIKILTYKIWNLSDDKPKFLIQTEGSI
jgi:hypothetical protein